MSYYILFTIWNLVYGEESNKIHNEIQSTVNVEESNDGIVEYKPQITSKHAISNSSNESFDDEKFYITYLMDALKEMESEGEDILHLVELLSSMTSISNSFIHFLYCLVGEDYKLSNNKIIFSNESTIMFGDNIFFKNADGAYVIHLNDQKYELIVKILSFCSEKVSISQNNTYATLLNFLLEKVNLKKYVESNVAIPRKPLRSPIQVNKTTPITKKVLVKKEKKATLTLKKRNPPPASSKKKTSSLSIKKKLQTQKKIIKK